ncbi:SDR family NAD(P)-dependent oxidoreductase [Diaminobutyricibacter sp. McL0618]|uniref:SDR family NAD(P)-dependent oxidoreductase n=1 Tax=Leifsonia sp. McL0618 TaxID=3415677 RepID=UPI003CF40FD4
MTEIAGRVAVVTGGASGIGLGIAQELAAAGAHVAIADISLETAASAARIIGAKPFYVDVANTASVARLASDTAHEFGTVDIIVNNAGVGPSGAISRMTLDDWHWLIDVNLFGVINGIQAFLPLLESNAHGGHIVNTSSMSGFAPMPGLGGYAVTKAGVTALTEVLARELIESGSRVRATVLAPGPVATNIGDSQRYRNPVSESGLETFVNRAASTDVLSPRDVGAIVCRAIERDDLFAITHPQFWNRVAERSARLEQAFLDATTRHQDGS